MMMKILILTICDQGWKIWQIITLNTFLYVMIKTTQD